MKWKFWIVAVGVVVLMSGGFVVNLGYPEVGQHTGYVTESGYRGLIWKTHYIKLVDAHFASYGSSSSSQGWWYYGFDEGNTNWATLFDKAGVAQTQNQLVTVSYECVLFIPQWQSSESCIVTGISSSNSTV